MTDAASNVVDTSTDPVAGWVDFPLIPDDFCLFVLKYYGAATGLFGSFDAIVLDEDFAAMWNVRNSGTTTERYLKKMRELAKEHPHPFDASEGEDTVSFLTSDRLVEKKRVIDIECESTNFKNWRHEQYDAILDPVLNTNETYSSDGSRHKSSGEYVFGQNNDKLSTIRVVFAENLDLTTRDGGRQPKLLMVDQFERFLADETDVFTGGNKFYVFTGAPPQSLFDVEKEQKFYRKLRERDRIIRTRLEVTDKFETTVPASLSCKFQHTRSCNSIWYAFLPYPSWLPEDKWDVRSVDLRLFDSNDTEFWRNVVYELFERERRSRVPENTTKRTDKNAKSNVRELALTIRLRVNEQDFSDTHGTDPLFAATRRFKRFAAFFAKIRQIITKNGMTNAPLISWSTPRKEMEYIQSIRFCMMREATIGQRERIVDSQRFVENVTRLEITSDCSLRTKRANWSSDNNVMGVIFDTLVNPTTFFGSHYAIGNSDAFLVRAKCGAPVYKIRQLEI